MIDEMQVKNLALIKQASLVPAQGLTVLTGETGAGKTALLSALKLLMGSRADKDSVRDGQDGLEVSGRFFGLSRASSDGDGQSDEDGELVAVRRGDIATHHLTGADTERTTRSRERLLLEMQRSLDHFDRQYSHIPVSRMVLASNPHVPGLATELAESVDIPVQELNLAEVLDFPKVPELHDPAVQAARLLAIGAALRGDDGGKP